MTDRGLVSRSVPRVSSALWTQCPYVLSFLLVCPNLLSKKNFTLFHNDANGGDIEGSAILRGVSIKRQFSFNRNSFNRNSLPLNYSMLFALYHVNCKSI